jgi:hypothetical protein
MDEILNPRPGGGSREREATEHLDPFLDRRVETRPWELRSAQWRAWVLAEYAFGDGVEVALAGRPGYESFRGLLYLTVPFRDLADHETRQGLFLDWAGRDPVLGEVPLIFVFQPSPVPTP